MATVIQIKRPSTSNSTTAPTQSNITTAEMAYVYGSATQGNGGQRLYIGNAAGNGVKVIGGEYFTEMFNDVFCALSDDDADPDVMYQGMLDALNDLLNYHRQACNRYEFMLERINKMREL